MSRRVFLVCGAAIVTALVALVGWAVAAGNSVVPVPGVVAGALLLYLLRRRVRGVTHDERNYRIGEKASRFTVRVFAFVAAIVGTTLVAADAGDSSSMETVGLTLAFSACALLILYAVSYAYLSRRS
ncbi:MAG: DUF2178 domain-containing protein [Chloroflexi bacterium]|nr:DUF2178 domain-containing protein [Chloroflexota bacterium]